MKYIERLLLLIAAVVLAGTNKCQEDYFFAVQSRVAITPTGTVTTTVDPDATNTPEPTATDEPTPTDEPDPTLDPDITETPGIDPTATSTPVATITATVAATTAALVMRKSGSADLLGELEKLDDPDATAVPVQSYKQAFGNAAALQENWLGNIYKDGETTEASGSWDLDTDGDGFVDALEISLGTDSQLSRSIPAGLPKTKLADRIVIEDRDFDGLTAPQEQEQGTSSEIKDSDGDGIPDGLEFLSGSNPLDGKSVPVDLDGDGLSDEYEVSEGTNPKQIDSDADGLSDGTELEIGSNPLVKDTDLDGITDYREYHTGGDPLISDFPVK